MRRCWRREEVQESQGQRVPRSRGPKVPRSQGPKYLNVTFKYKLEFVWVVGWVWVVSGLFSSAHFSRTLESILSVTCYDDLYSTGISVWIFLYLSVSRHFCIHCLLRNQKIVGILLNTKIVGILLNTKIAGNLLTSKIAGILPSMPLWHFGNFSNL